MTLENGLALIILVGRLGGVLSTLFVTPNLVLEANPVVRRFKWPTMIAGFALCVVPYFDILLAIMVAVPSLLITASNLTRGWMATRLESEKWKRLFSAQRRAVPSQQHLRWFGLLSYSWHLRLVFFSGSRGTGTILLS